MDQGSSTAEFLTRIRELREQLQHRELLLRLVHQQVDNHEDLEDTRSTLVEHLVFDRRTLQASVEAGGQRFAQIKTDLEREIESRRFLTSPEGEFAQLDARRSEAEETLKALRKKSSDLRAQLDAAETQTRDKIESTRQRSADHQREIDAELASIAGLEEQLQSTLRNEQERLTQLAGELDTAREAVEAARAEETVRTLTRTDDLRAARDELDAAREGAERSEANVKNIEQRHERLQQRVDQLRRMLVEAREAEPAEPEAPKSTLVFAEISAEPDEDDLAHAVFDFISDVDDVGSTPVEVQNNPPPATSPLPSAPDGPADSPGLDSKPQLVRLGRNGVEARLMAGARIDFTAKFSTYQHVDPIDRELHDILGQADEFAGLRALAPATLREGLVDHLFRFYELELIELVD